MHAGASLHVSGIVTTYFSECGWYPPVEPLLYISPEYEYRYGGIYPVAILSASAAVSGAASTLEVSDPNHASHVESRADRIIICWLSHWKNVSCRDGILVVYLVSIQCAD